MMFNNEKIFYKFPLWNSSSEYRATAIAYMQRERVSAVEDTKGNFYTLEQLQSQVINPKV